MSTGLTVNGITLEQLSALVDGELEPAQAEAACACWRADAGARESWHSYHLIGDVLRSEDLAIEPARDAVFLARLRSRLDEEAVVLSPGESSSSERDEATLQQRRSALRSQGGGVRRWPWMASSAIAAGFVAVAGVYTLMRSFEPSSSSGGATIQAVAPVAVDAPGSRGAGNAEAARDGSGGGMLIRDPRLDVYLAAHKQFAGSSALGVPSAFLRGATVNATGR